jgi:hypothetical protein
MYDSKNSALLLVVAALEDEPAASICKKVKTRSSRRIQARAFDCNSGEFAIIWGEMSQYPEKRLLPTCSEYSFLRYTSLRLRNATSSIGGEYGRRWPRGLLGSP